MEAKAKLEPNVIAVQVFGIGVSARITGVKQAFGLLRKGAHKVASAAERKLATK